MGLFNKKKTADSQQPAPAPVSQGVPSPQPQAPQAPIISQQPQPLGQFLSRGGVQAAPAPQPTGFFGKGPQDISPAPQMQSEQPAQPVQLAQPTQQPEASIPFFPKLSPQSPAPASPPAGSVSPLAVSTQPAPPVSQRADAAAVKEAVHKPALEAPLSSAPAPTTEGSDFFSELQEPESSDSPFGLTPLDEVEDAATEEQPAPKEPPVLPDEPEEPAFKEEPSEPTTPMHSRGREIMHGDQPLFVSVQQYVSILDSLKDVRKSIKEFEKITHSIDSLKDKTLISCKSWQGHLDDIHKKLAYIDRVLFEG